MGNGNGYCGWSQSNNAVAARKNGEMPISNWTKTEIIKAAAKIDKGKAKLLEKVKASVLKDYLLVCRGWHHTSSMYNETDFYAVDEDYIKKATQEEIQELASLGREKKEAEERVIYKGDLRYSEWEGSRNYGRFKEHALENVTIEERGCYYYVYNDTGKEILKKKISGKHVEVRREGSRHWE